MTYKIKSKKLKEKQEFFNEEQIIDRQNWKVFLKNNGMSANDYPYYEYEMDMKKERAKDPSTFNARY